MIQIKSNLLRALQIGGKERVIEALQQAVELEHSTIPPYLYAMFSLKPVDSEHPDRNVAIVSILRSVVVEEMLHMTIVCNVLNALGGSPIIDHPDFIPTYPGHLPGSVESGLVVGLQPFSTELMNTVFMKIEQPEEPLSFPVLAALAAPPVTIGQFYEEIKQQLRALGDAAFVGDPARQVREPFGDAHVVTDVATACRGIDVIINQGEGTTQTPVDLQGDFAHYYRFAQLWKLQRLIPNPDGRADLPPDQRYVFGPPIAFELDAVFNAPTLNNPVAAAAGTAARHAQDNFNYTYTSLLKTLHSLFNGRPTLFGRSFGVMMSMRQQAIDMMSATSLPDAVGPTFLYQATNPAAQPGPTPVAAPAALVMAASLASTGAAEIDLGQPLDLESPAAADFLRGLQANILKNHGRNHARHLLLRFPASADPAPIRQWIADFAATRITSALRQRHDTAAWKATNGADSGQQVMTIHLSAAGYRALGLTDADMPVEPRAPYFRRGMRVQAGAEPPVTTYGDPPVARWDEFFREPIHAMILVAGDDPAWLDRTITALTEELYPLIEAFQIDVGTRLYQSFHDKADVIEHFGFRDGLSDPLFIKQDIAASDAKLGSSDWDPGAPLDLALVAEPGAPARYGSFLVYRKLEQNVRGWWDTMHQIGEKFSIDPERVGAMAVGRFRDGTPILDGVKPPSDGEPANNFNYLGDFPGKQCPFHAHVRKTNPRGDTVRLSSPADPTNPENQSRAIAFERKNRIARRAITYGERPDLAPGAQLPLPTGGVGLLFSCFQADLGQFAIQQDGSDSGDFVAQGASGVDGVIGQVGLSDAPPVPEVPQQWPAGSGREFAMANFVRMLGGEYFYAPSLGFLRGLAGGAPGKRAS